MKGLFKFILAFVIAGISLSNLFAQININTPEGTLALMMAKVIVSTNTISAPSETTLPFSFTSELFKAPQNEPTNTAAFNRVSFQLYLSTNTNTLANLSNLASNNPDFPPPAGILRISMSKTRAGNAIVVTGSASRSAIAVGTRIYYRLAKRITNCSGCSGVDPTVFSPAASFVLPLTDIDGNIYDTIKIGNQLWMRENLKVSKYRDGTAIPNNVSRDSWENTTSGAYSVYDNKSANNDIYGKLYNWYTVKDSRKICPLGWHVPSDAEWTVLENFLGGSSIAGGKMKAVSSLWASPNVGATNSSGFYALPGGYRRNDGAFNGNMISGVSGYWWSTTQIETSSPPVAYGRVIDSNNSSLTRYINFKSAGFSVRCVRD